MKNSRHDIDEHLLLQYLLGNADEELRTTVEVWLNADSGNRKRLDQLESLWLETGKLSPAPVAVDADAAWLRMSGLMAEHNDAVSSPHVKVKTIRKSPFRYLMAAAAMILVLVGIYSIYKLISGRVKQTEMISRTEIVHDTLPDGSRVALNRNSTLVFPEKFEKRFREVKLTGEAFFEVNHDEMHPFIVHAGIAGVRVLGTSFRVKTSPGGQVEVSVTEGRVLFFSVEPRTGDTVSVILAAGETGRWQPGNMKPMRTGSLAPDGHFWANHSLDFRSTALSEVFSLLEQYYSVKITVRNSAIMNCRLTASFVNEPPDRILAVIAESFGLTVEVRNQYYYLNGDGCNKENN
jgi:transmembrane sensor